MAVYDGFFDAVQNEDTGEYDRAYSSGEFTNYFDKIIGTGVCIHGNPDSFFVRLEDGKAVVSPGYLFIQGYWCKNDADYSIDLPGTGNYAIVAHLNLGKRMIELDARSVAQAYPDSLVLAIVSPASAEDTRHNTDICGTIDTAGELSSKVEWAINYIDNEIESKLAAVEQDINAQAARLDRKIEEVQAVADSIVPPPVGTIKFSASKDVGEEWLRCDGSFINEADYPELVAALGKLIPSGDKFQLISNGEIGPQISNGALYAGRMWVYSYSTKKLYGVDVTGTAAIKEIPVASEDEHFGDFIPPSTTSPIALSIVPHKIGTGARLFLAQVLSEGGASSYPEMASFFLMFQCEFTGDESSISVSLAFQSISPEVVATTSSSGQYQTLYNVYFSPGFSVPTVTSKIISGVEAYFFACGYTKWSNPYSAGYDYSGYISWTGAGNAQFNKADPIEEGNRLSNQRWGFSGKDKGEAVFVDGRAVNNTGVYHVYSYPFGTFDTSFNSGTQPISTRAQKRPLNIAGADKVLSAYDLDLFPWISLVENTALSAKPGLRLPSTARIFVDAGAYLWGKDIFMIFVGTGIIFSRTLEDGSFGYLDTTSVLGSITQFGYLDYSQDEGTLYLLGQDTTNTVKAAKIALNTLYDYANDGAWLPMIAADGVPAYIKAYNGEQPDTGEKVPMQITVQQPTGGFGSYAELLFNGESLIPGTFTRQVNPNGKFSVGVHKTSDSGFNVTVYVTLNGNTVASTRTTGETKTASFNVSDYAANGITLQGGAQ